jgi:hypothetical protein
MVAIAKTTPSGTSIALSGLNTAIVLGNYEHFMLGSSNFRFTVCLATGWGKTVEKAATNANADVAAIRFTSIIKCNLLNLSF